MNKKVSDYQRQQQKCNQEYLEFKELQKKQKKGLSPQEQKRLEEAMPRFGAQDAALQKALLQCADIGAPLVAQQALEQLCALGANEHLRVEGSLLEKCLKDPKKFWLLQWLDERGVDLKGLIKSDKHPLRGEDGWVSPFYVALGSNNVKAVDFLFKKGQVVVRSDDMQLEDFWECKVEVGRSIFCVPLGATGALSKGLQGVQKMLDVLLGAFSKNGQLDVGEGCSQLLREFLVQYSDQRQMLGLGGALETKEDVFSDPSAKKSLDIFLKSVLPKVSGWENTYVLRDGINRAWDVGSEDYYHTHLVEQVYLRAPGIMINVFEAQECFVSARKSIYSNVQSINKTLVTLLSDGVDLLSRALSPVKGYRHAQEEDSDPYRMSDVGERVDRFLNTVRADNPALYAKWKQECSQVLLQSTPLKEKGFDGTQNIGKVQNALVSKASGSESVMQSVVECGSFGYVAKHALMLCLHLEPQEKQSECVLDFSFNDLPIRKLLSVEGAAALESKVERTCLGLQMGAGSVGAPRVRL